MARGPKPMRASSSAEEGRQMTCVECGGRMVGSTVAFDNDVRGTAVRVSVQGYKCAKCGFSTIDLSRMAEYGRAVADSYRARHGLLTSDQIRTARERLRMSQGEFADYLGIGIASVKRWEAGQVQERSMDRLLRLMTDPDVAQRHARTLKDKIGGSSA